MMAALGRIINKLGEKGLSYLSGLSCYVRDGFCGMAHSFGIKKCYQSNSDSEDEVRDEFPFLNEENERLGKFLVSQDDMLREAKKMRSALLQATKKV
jgi:hypothetical protein